MSATAQKSLAGQTLLLAIVVVAIAAFAFNKLPARDKPNDQTVTVSAIWTPSPRVPEGVQVIVFVGGLNPVNGRESVAPWSRTYPASKGDRVEVTLELKGDKGGFLGCSILVNGVEAVTEHIKDAKPFEKLTCWTHV